MKRFLTLALSLVIAVTVMAADKATAYFTVSPAMTCQNCENKIKSNLRYEKGVKEIATSLSNQVVTVTYDPAKTDASKLIAAFKKIGYTASATQAPKAGAAKCTKKSGACCKDKKASNCCGKGDCASKKSCPNEQKACKGEKKSCTNSCTNNKKGCPKK